MATRRNILIVDDERPTVDSLELLLGEDFNLHVARSGEEALRMIASQPVDMAFLDISLPGMDGFETLREIKKREDAIDVVMLTADEKARSAMRAMELGAFHYITKPFDKDDVLLVTRRILEKRNLTDEVVALRDEVRQMEAFHSMVGADPKMKDLFKLITRVAATDSSVLITGESGTGKELVAKAIHLQSPRVHKHFKAIHCGAIPENLLESELFGHEKGSFTGASERKIGKFEMANGGTLLLDEISSMKETMQVKLLRVLQEREIERVGGIKSIPVDVRILAASNAAIKKLVENGTFREDLFYRLNVIHIHLPPLRERPSDVSLLADHFLSGYAQKFNRPVLGISPEARSLLESYPWPGNVRELKNVIERAVVLCDGDLILREHLPLDLAIPRQECSGSESDGFHLKDIMDSYERKVLLSILERFNWNQTRTADVLGIHRNTLIAKLDHLQINIREMKEQSSNKILA